MPSDIEAALAKVRRQRENVRNAACNSVMIDEHGQCWSSGAAELALLEALLELHEYHVAGVKRTPHQQQLQATVEHALVKYTAEPE
jgi:F420-0:gamma-glutamyl ligase